MATKKSSPQKEPQEDLSSFKKEPLPMALHALLEEFGADFLGRTIRPMEDHQNTVLFSTYSHGVAPQYWTSTLFLELGRAIATRIGSQPLLSAPLDLESSDSQASASYSSNASQSVFSAPSTQTSESFLSDDFKSLHAHMKAIWFATQEQMDLADQTLLDPAKVIAHGPSEMDRRSFLLHLYGVAFAKGILVELQAKSYLQGRVWEDALASFDEAPHLLNDLKEQLDQKAPYFADRLISLAPQSDAFRSGLALGLLQGAGFRDNFGSLSESNLPPLTPAYGVPDFFFARSALTHLRKNHGVNLQFAFDAELMEGKSFEYWKRSHFNFSSSEAFFDQMTHEWGGLKAFHESLDIIESLTPKTKGASIVTQTVDAFDPSSVLSAPKKATTRL